MIRFLPLAASLVSAATLASAASAAAAPALLTIGTGTSVITPFLDAPMAGYYYERQAEGVHDDLFAKALFFDDGTTRAALVACDLVRMPRAAVDDARRRLQQRLGLPATHVMISATHSHTGPQTTDEFVAVLARRIADSVTTAVGNARPARLFATTEQEASLPHNRRYLMKDGTTATNPGFLNPNVVQPQGPIDPRVAVLHIEETSGARPATWVNYALHLDTVGGPWISADFPFYLGRLLARVHGPDLLTIFTIGTAGNINHWDVRRPGPQRGHPEARRIGEVLGAAVLKAHTHLAPIEAAKVRAASATIELPTPRITEEEVAAARRIMATPPPPNVDFTLDRVKAARNVALGALGGRPLSAEVQVIVVGPVAFVGLPGELFVELGLELQRASPFPFTFLVGQANDTLGYLPNRAAYDQGGYEPTSARMLPGGGELIVAQALELLRQLHR